jgi:hypothetical protein
MSRMNATVQKGMDRDYDDEDVNRHSSKVDDVTDDVVEAATADLKKPARSAKKTTKRHKKSKR